MHNNFNISSAGFFAMQSLWIRCGRKNACWNEKGIGHKKQRFYLRMHSAKLLIQRNLHKLPTLRETKRELNATGINEMRFILDDNFVSIALISRINSGKNGPFLMCLHVDLSLAFVWCSFYLRANVRCFLISIFVGFLHLKWFDRIKWNAQNILLVIVFCFDRTFVNERHSIGRCEKGRGQAPKNLCTLIRDHQEYMDDPLT